MTDLEMLLSGSLQIAKMQEAIKQALPLMRAERDSKREAAALGRRRGHWATAMMSEDDANLWTAAIDGLEASCEQR